MRIIFFLLVLGLQASAQTVRPIVLPVKENNKWGAIDADGNIVVQLADYDSLHRLNSPYIAIKQQGKWGVNRLNRKLLPAVFDEVVPFHDSTFIVCKGNLWGIVDYNNTELLPCSFISIKPVNNRFLMVCKEDKLWGVYSSNNIEVIPLSYTKIEVFYSYNYFRVFKGRLQGLINFESKLIVPVDYDSIKPLSGRSDLFLTYKNGLGGLINNKGERLLPDEYSSLMNYPGYNKLFYKGSGGWGCVDFKNKILLGPEWDEIEFDRSSMNYLRIRKNGQWGIYSIQKQKICCYPAYNDIHYFNEEYFIIGNRGRVGIVNSKCQTILDTVYQSVFDDANGNWRVSRLDRYGLSDKQGKLLLETIYDNISANQGGPYILSLNGKFGLASREGKIICPVQYDMISAFDKNIALIRLKDKYGIVNAKGVITLPVQYDSIKVFEGTAKAYDRKGLTLASFEDNGDISDIQKYGHIKSLHIVSKRRAASAGVNSGKIIKPFSMRDYGWFFSAEIQKWGLQDKNGNIRLSPVFDMVLCFGNSNSSKVSIIRGRDTLHGIVNHSKGIIIHEPKYRFIDFKPDAALWKATDESGRICILHTADAVNYSYRARVSDTLRRVKWIADIGDVLIFTKILLHDPVDGSEKWGYIDSKANLAIEPEFDEVMDFTNYGAGYFRAFVRKGNYWGVINDEGEVVLPFMYLNVPAHYRRGDDVILKVRAVNPQYGYINEKGDIIAEPAYEYAGRFENGLAKVANDSGAYTDRKRLFWNYMDRNGKLLLSGSLRNAGDFNGEVAVVRDNQGRFGAIDRKGKFILKPEYDEIEDFDDGLAMIKKGGRYGYLGSDGSIVIPPMLEDRLVFKNKVAIGKSDGKYGLIDARQGWVISPSYYELAWLDSGKVIKYRKERKERLYGLMDEKGKRITNPKFENLKTISEGYAAASVQKKWGYINTRGKWMIKAQYYEAGNFMNGLATVRPRIKYITINKKGRTTDSAEVILPAAKEEMKPVMKDTVKSYKRELTHKFDYPGFNIREKKGSYLVLKEGQSILELDGIEDMKEGLARIWVDTTWGILSSGGYVLMEPVYDRIVDEDFGIIRLEKNNMIGYYDMSYRRWIWKLSK